MKTSRKGIDHENEKKVDHADIRGLCESVRALRGRVYTIEEQVRELKGHADVLLDALEGLDVREIPLSPRVRAINKIRRLLDKLSGSDPDDIPF